MQDIARLAGVSVSTVSRALAGSHLVARGKREEIVRLAAERGYVVNTTARNLRLKRSETLSVAIPLGQGTGQSLTDPFFVRMIGHVADEITQRGYGMYLQKVLPPTESWLERLIDAGRADGIIVIGQNIEHAALQEAAAYRPLVVWGGHEPGQRYCTVGSDNVAGATAAVEHLLATGRRAIVFLGDTRVPEIRLRYEGYRCALESAPQGSAGARLLATPLAADAGYEALRALMREGAALDAVFGATDLVAIGALRALADAGRRVPGDVAVVGFDDIALAAHTTPPLTTVRQDFARGARTLVDLLLRRIAGEDTPSAVLQAELIVRDSSLVRGA